MLNDKKICFITCVNDDLLYDECLRYIRNLDIPKGYEVETVAIKQAKSITTSYNEAMNRSNAKYKVYIHQDAFIVDKEFMAKILDAFKDEFIGLIGADGCEKLPTNAVWREAKKCYFNLYDNTNGGMKEKKLNNIKVHPNVECIDGLVMITQYDVTWREDIFDGWHFYDISQSIEFKRYGYNTVILNTDIPWILHDCGTIGIIDDSKYDKYKTIFLDEYSKELFPLVSIMITAYNRPEYFRIALESAINQDYINKEIIVCDNSTNNEVEGVAKKYIDNPIIRYYKNEKGLRVIENFNKAISLSKGEYICFLMDDDIYAENKLTKMMKYFLEDNDVSLVTSYRRVIDQFGNEKNDISETRKLFNEVTYLDENMVKEYVLNTRLNFIGETTTPIFKKSLLRKEGFGQYKGQKFEVISDLVTWISMVEQGKLIYIPETLSYFRIQQGQEQRKPETIAKGMIEFIKLVDFLMNSERKIYDENMESFLKYIIDATLVIEKNNVLNLEEFINNILNIINKFDGNTIKESFIIHNLLRIIKKLVEQYKYNIDISKYYDKCQTASDMVDDKKYIEYINSEYDYKHETYRELKVNNKINITKEDVKYICYYLPQFHSIPENDIWWGKGFTEWTNVTRAMPLFNGHYQPHLPGELGFYNLLDKNVLKRQIDLAKNYGIHGFCYHYYWFNSKRLLEKPLDILLNNKDLDMPFCICWANENWTRRWDGQENEILMEQNHNKDNDIKIVKDFIKCFKDKRYIRVNGKPLLIIYRSDIIPNFKETVNIWRGICREEGIGEIYIIGARTFNFLTPENYGLDGAVEFPPHRYMQKKIAVNAFNLSKINFEGTLYDYKALVKNKLYKFEENYKFFKGIIPSWDNTARKNNKAVIYHGSTPELYKDWLKDISDYTKEKFEGDERMVFINAWNEWGEGAHLEPDRRFGYAYLEATYDVFKEVNNKCIDKE